MSSSLIPNQSERVLPDTCEHSTLTGYTKGCRTPNCRKMHADYQHNKRGYNNRKPLMDPNFPGHGIITCYICGKPVVEHPITQRCG